jgi:NAD(P)-dependent dehydrogenase (short-subunit alcohol dehydrogenase family)
VADNNKERRRTAFVTGGVTGIGAAIAVALARNGYDVAVSAREAARLAGTLGEIENAGARAVPIALELSSLDSIEAAAAGVFDAFGQVDLLVNNAAAPLLKAALEVTPQEWDSVMQPNLKGTFFLTQKVGLGMVERSTPGTIVNIASTHGMVALAQRSVYGIAKAALIHMTRMLAIEWAQHHITVNAVAPGTVETPSRAVSLADPKVRKMMLDRVPLARFATTQEIADAVVYLGSPAAAFITGHTLVLDGGLTAY